MKNFPSQPPMTFRQKQLLKQNSKLRQQLRSAHMSITRLKSQIEQLKNQIKFLRIENEKLQQNNFREDNDYSDVRSRSLKSKSNKSIKLTKNFNQQMEVFTSSSQSETDECEHYKPTTSLIHPLGKQKSKNHYFQEDKGLSILSNQKGSEIKLRPKASQQKPLKKIDSQHQIPRVTYFDVDADDDNTFSTLNSRHGSKVCISMNNINLTKSQRLIPLSQQKNSMIQEQGPARSPKIFKKVSIGKPIYDVFFVTGLSKKNQPEVIYCYPRKSDHFGPILAICYGEDFIKAKDNGSTSSKNLLNVSSQGTTGKIKEFYVIPLRKLDQDQDEENSREYLTICQVQQIVLVSKQSSFTPCTFSRLYCFISGTQFFTCFKNLINQFLDKITSIKSQSRQSYMNQAQYKQLLQQSLQQPLMILSQKSAQANHTLNYRLDSSISVSIDIPSLDNSYKLISQFRPWGVMNFKLQIRPQQQYVTTLETKLFGILLTYVLSQQKVILFSSQKSKISESILHLLQIIKPLEYVCPIIMTVLKEEHEQYFSAPMSLLLGLWIEQKKMQKQKIQIFMNRKENLCGMIEKGKIIIENGIIINLDTGLVYGGGLKQNLTSLALIINEYYQNYCHHPKDVFKLFDKLFNHQLSKNQVQLYQLKQKLLKSLEGTQLYTYFKQRAQKKKNYFSN